MNDTNIVDENCSCWQQIKWICEHKKKMKTEYSLCASVAAHSHTCCHTWKTNFLTIPHLICLVHGIQQYFSVFILVSVSVSFRLCCIKFAIFQFWGCLACVQPFEVEMFYTCYLPHHSVQTQKQIRFSDPFVACGLCIQLCTKIATCLRKTDQKIMPHFTS